MEDEQKIKELCQILNISQSKIEQLIRIERFSQTHPEIFEKVRTHELSINKADALIRSIEQHEDLVQYAKIPLNDPYRAANILLNCLGNKRIDQMFVRILVDKLSESLE